jgi:hypothetical protein
LLKLAATGWAVLTTYLSAQSNLTRPGVEKA